MKTKAIIFDLDNTLFDTPSIGDTVFGPIYDIVKSRESEFNGDMDGLKKDLNRKPFPDVAKNYGFSHQLFEDCLSELWKIEFDGIVKPFSGYEFVQELPQKKFIVTAGFPKLQQSKIDALGIGLDFEKSIIVDTAGTDETKKTAFEKILGEYGFEPSEVLVIGDDAESELKAAKELGMRALLYNPKQLKTEEDSIASFAELSDFA